MRDTENSSVFQVLIVDDHHLVRSLIGAYLEGAGYQVWTAGSGKEMFEQLDAHDLDLVILDLGLPDEDGIVLARKLRARSTMPLIILTAREGQDDRSIALEVGADDYLIKSIDPKEFLLRVRNLLQRGKRAGTNKTVTMKGKGSVVEFDGWQLDPDGYEVRSPKGDVISLTPMEIKLLAILVQNKGRVLSRDRLLDAISGYDDAPSDRMIDSFISRIRKRIEDDPKKPKKIVTVTGVGYKFEG